MINSQFAVTFSITPFELGPLVGIVVLVDSEELLLVVFEVTVLAVVPVRLVLVLVFVVTAARNTAVSWWGESMLIVNGWADPMALPSSSQ